MGCKVSKWQDKSNEEINAAVTGHRFNCSKWTLSDDKKSFFIPNRGVGPENLEIALLDYCGNWSFAGPLIHENSICLTSPTTGRKRQLWSASWNEDGGRWAVGDIAFSDKNPLRAAMIVYLEMNGVQPNE